MVAAAKYASRLFTSRPFFLSRSSSSSPILKYPHKSTMMTSSAATAPETAAERAAEAEVETKAKVNYKIIQDSGNFRETEAARPDFDHSASITVTKSPFPEWSYGQGVPSTAPKSDSTNTNTNNPPTGPTHHEIDPYAETRPTVNNYRLLVSGIAPRPIGFISSVSADGKTENLAPFSYFQVIDHDPPMFILGFSSRPGVEKDTFRNLKETGECVINTVSENMIEAVNATSIDAPYGISEWEISGLTKAASTTVRPARVQESVFSVEGVVVDVKEFEAHSAGMSGAGVVLVKATRFWVQEGAVDEELKDINLEKLRPVAQLGGISYGRISSVFERPRKRWEGEVGKSELLAGLEKKS
ncbi:hypothetical protein BJX99DRAFT_45813 [Aspergillus californicus]